MRVSYGTLLATLAALHPDLERASIVARLQYLQRADFPVARRPDVSRIDYGAEGLMKLAMAFELLSAGAPPGTIAPLVSGGWSEIGPALKGAWRQRAVREFARPVFARINGIGGKDRDVGRLLVGTSDDLRRWMQGEGEIRTMLVVDAARLARAVATVGEAMGAEVAGVVGALDRWAA